MTIKASQTTRTFAPPSRVRELRTAAGVSCLLAAALTVAGVCVAPVAVADDTENLRAAVAASRPPTCGALRSDPIIDQAALGINRTTDRWINHESRAVPETDALPVLRDLGYGGSKASILSGASTDAGKAIKVTILQGFKLLPDCSFSDFGVSTLYNAKKNMILTTVVLAAP